MVSKKFENMLLDETTKAVNGNDADLISLLNKLNGAANSAMFAASMRINKNVRDDFKRMLVVCQLGSFINFTEITELPYADYIDKEKVLADFSALEAKQRI